MANSTSLVKEKSATRNNSKDFQTTNQYKKFAREMILTKSPNRSGSILPDVFKSEVPFIEAAEQGVINLYQNSPRDEN